MPKSFMHKVYGSWIEENGHFFKHKPIITLNHKKNISFKFDGISSIIQGHIDSKGGFIITVDYQGFNWDIIMELDLYEERTDDGKYYCEMCKDGIDDGYNDEELSYYDSRKELWIGHCFSPFLEWSNSYINKDHVLHLWGEKDHSTSVQIHEKNAVLRDGWFILDIIEA